MRNNLKFLFLPMVIVFSLPSADADPPSISINPLLMQKFVVKMTAGNPPVDSFAAEPTTIIRAGTELARVEEVYSPKDNVHMLVLVKGSDIQRIDLVSKTGQKIHEPDVSHKVHLPVFVFPTGYKEAQSLEYGQELEFFLKRKPARSKEILLGQAVNRYNIVTDKELYIYLWVSIKSQKPIQIVSGKGKYFQTIQYESYEKNLPFDGSLFEPPVGITYADHSVEQKR